MAEHRCSRGRAIPNVRGPDDAAALVRMLVCDEHHEGQLVIGLDRARRPIDAVFRCPCERCRDERITDVRDLVDIAVELGAPVLVLVTFVTDERLPPTLADIARFEGLRLECVDDDVVLLDHLLMSGHRWRSVGDLSAGCGA